MAHYDYYEETVDRTSLRYVLYARRSSEDEDAQVRSIPDQIKQCQQFAEREGLHIVEIVEEKKSAKVPNKRDEFNRVVRLSTYSTTILSKTFRLLRIGLPIMPVAK
jgi:predicted site-specific integrase-resolvase